MPHTRKKKPVEIKNKKENFKVNWEALADSIILAIENNDLGYRDFKKAQHKIDLRYGNRPLEIKQEVF